MTPELILEIVLTVLTGIVFAWGDFKFFRKRVALYMQMVTCAVGCAFLTRVFETIQIWRNGETTLYSLSLLGVTAEFLFLFCANYGVIDSLCDDRSKRFIKYRLIALIIPVTAGVFSILQYRNLASRCEGDMPYLLYIPVLVILLAMYFHIKHLIIPDVENGIVRRIRLFNLLGVINSMAVLAYFFTRTGDVLWYVAVVLCVLSTATMLPLLNMGAKRWTKQ